MYGVPLDRTSWLIKQINKTFKSKGSLYRTHFRRTGVELCSLDSPGIKTICSAIKPKREPQKQCPVKMKKTSNFCRFSSSSALHTHSLLLRILFDHTYVLLCIFVRVTAVLNHACFSNNNTSESGLLKCRHQVCGGRARDGFVLISSAKLKYWWKTDLFLGFPLQERRAITAADWRSEWEGEGKENSRTFMINSKQLLCYYKCRVLVYRVQI